MIALQGLPIPSDAHFHLVSYFLFCRQYLESCLVWAGVQSSRRQRNESWLIYHPHLAPSRNIPEGSASPSGGLFPKFFRRSSHLGYLRLLCVSCCCVYQFLVWCFLRELEALLHSHWICKMCSPDFWIHLITRLTGWAYSHSLLILKGSLNSSSFQNHTILFLCCPEILILYCFLKLWLNFIWSTLLKVSSVSLRYGLFVQITHSLSLNSSIQPLLKAVKPLSAVIIIPVSSFPRLWLHLRVML